MKDEEQDVAEWVIYHSLIGFHTFVIYDNGSNDLTPLVLDRLRRVYDIKLIEWPRATKYSQLEAYDDCIKNFREDFDWIAFIDSDEFIAPVRDGNMQRFLQAHETAGAIALNWAVFGSSGHVGLPPRLTIQSFTKRANEEVGVNAHTKMIVRPKLVVRVENPHFISIEYKPILKADGTLLIKRGAGTSVDMLGFDICRINHYFVKSRVQWLAKMSRGYREGVRPDDHFEAHDLNDVEDLWAANHGVRVKNALKAIQMLPLRARRPSGPIASTAAEKLSTNWQAISSEVDDVMFRAPEYARQEGNKLFDRDFYLALYEDVRMSGMDPFLHFSQSGFIEGRRPCSRESLVAFLKSRGEPTVIEISRSDRYDGNITLLSQRPQVLHLSDYVYCPQNVQQCVPGIYGFGRKAVHQSQYSRGPNPSIVLPNCSMPFAYSDVTEYAEEDHYIYLGAAHPHFGHFLLSTLSRLWQIRSMPPHPIICYGLQPGAIRPHIKALFEAFGVDPARLVNFSHPIKIRNLVLPCPSLEEQNFVHEVFSSSYVRAGNNLARGVSLEVPGDGPIYLSKSKIVHGVRKILNEEQIEQRLAKAGFSIVYPETLSIGEQVSLWRLGRTIVGFSGSGLLTSTFSRDARIISLRWDNTIDTTFPLIDWACGHSTDYFHFEPGVFEDLGPTPGSNGISGLSSRLVAQEPIEVAEAILRVCST